MGETYILLTSETAARPTGSKNLDGEWTFTPPLSLSSSEGEYCIALQDFQQETSALLVEVDTDLEIDVGLQPTTWIPICKSLYFDPQQKDGGVGDLFDQIRKMFETINDIIGVLLLVPAPLDRAPPMLVNVGRQWQMAANGCNVRFSTALQKMLTFPQNYVESGQIITSKKKWGIPPLMPVYLTIDIGNTNCIIPQSHSFDSRFESVLAAANISLDSKCESFLVERQFLPVVVRGREIFRLRVSLRYSETGNVVRSNGLLDRFSFGLILKKRLALEI